MKLLVILVVQAAAAVAVAPLGQAVRLLQVKVVRVVIHLEDPLAAAAVKAALVNMATPMVQVMVATAEQAQLV